MRFIFIAGSRKGSEKIYKIKTLLEKSGLIVLLGRDTPSTEDDKIKEMFKRIDKADIIYVVSENGYIGKTVSMEIAYAYSKRKTIFSSEKIEDNASELIDDTLNKNELLELLSDNHPNVTDTHSPR